jgi:hypothetical protein
VYSTPAAGWQALYGLLGAYLNLYPSYTFDAIMNHYAPSPPNPPGYGAYVMNAINAALGTSWDSSVETIGDAANGVTTGGGSSGSTAAPALQTSGSDNSGLTYDAYGDLVDAEGNIVVPAASAAAVAAPADASGLYVAAALLLGVVVWEWFS